jgi:hypothetical protein
MALEKPVLEPPKFEVQDYVSYDYVYASCDIEHRKSVYRYYGQFGIPGSVCDQWLIGWDDHFKGYVLPYELHLKRRSYLIGAQIRLDKPSDNKHRFLSKSGSKAVGWTNNKLVSLDFMEDGEEGPKLPYIMITESHKDMMLLLSMGYYATAWRPEQYWEAHVNEALKNIARPVIIQDADDGPGRETAKKLQKLIGPRAMRVSTASLKAKSPTDYIKDSHERGVIGPEKNLVKLFEGVGICEST